MTPCQALGYKVGDTFLVIKGDGMPYQKGATVELIKDDGTDIPLFKQITGRKRGDGRWYECLKNLQPIPEAIKENE